MLSGLLALHSLPIGQFPAIAPPAVTITATYPAADPQTMDATTTQYFACPASNFSLNHRKKRLLQATRLSLTMGAITRRKVMLESANLLF